MKAELRAVSQDGAADGDPIATTSGRVFVIRCPEHCNRDMYRAMSEQGQDALQPGDALFVLPHGFSLEVYRVLPE